MKKETNRFDAIDEENNSFTVIEYTEFIPSGTWGNPNQMEEGLKEYRLVSGEAVNRKSDDEFKIVASGKNIRRQ